MKRCTCCNFKKNLDEYYSTGPGKFTSKCKLCFSYLQSIRNKFSKIRKSKEAKEWLDSLEKKSSNIETSS